VEGSLPEERGRSMGGRPSAREAAKCQYRAAGDANIASLGGGGSLPEERGRSMGQSHPGCRARWARARGEARWARGAQVGLVTYGTHVHVHELGFTECAKSYVFQARGAPALARRILPNLNLSLHAIPCPPTPHLARPLALPRAPPLHCVIAEPASGLRPRRPPPHFLRGAGPLASRGCGVRGACGT